MAKAQDAPAAGVTLADLLGGEADLEVLFGPAALHVTYDPREVRSTMIDAEAGQHALAEATVRVVRRWDLVRHGGVVWPLTVQDVADVPVVVLLRVLKAIVQDQQADPR